MTAGASLIGTLQC